MVSIDNSENGVGLALPLMRLMAAASAFCSGSADSSSSAGSRERTNSPESSDDTFCAHQPTRTSLSDAAIHQYAIAHTHTVHYM